MRASISIITGSHVCHNPRALKEATTLAEEGFSVEILGAWVDADLKRKDIALLANCPFRFTPVVDLTERSFRSQCERLFLRFRTRLANEAFRRIGYANSWQLGYSITALRSVAIRSTADLFIAHSESALIIARELLHLGRRVGVDMEDWFSEDLFPDVRNQRPLQLLQRAERDLLRKGVHSSCPSLAMSRALTRIYECRPPTVVHNAFPVGEAHRTDGQYKDRRDRSVPSIHWFSQTLGMGRGLEDLLAALSQLEHPAEIHLRGKPVNGFERWLALTAPASWRDKIFIHDLVENDELLSRIAEHDIGFAGEMKFCQSRNLTITNKILQYLLAGLAVVASDTVGQTEVAEDAHGAVSLYPSGDSIRLANLVNELLSTPKLLADKKQAALISAKEKFCWERQIPKLLASVEKALAS